MTISDQDAKELSLAATPVSKEAAQHVLDYLVWNKSLIGENLATNDRLENYMDLVHNMKEGVHVIIQDPYERATALLFELVLSDEFNPWAIDLVRFTQLFRERTKDEQTDFPVAGQLILMAWRILLKQSEAILSLRKEPEVPADASATPIMDDGYLGEMGSTEELDATTAILTSPNAPFDAMVRHAENRPVTLMELTNAFKEAEKQAKLGLEVDRMRNRLREEQAVTKEVLVHGEEVPMADLQSAWEVALRHPKGERFPVEEIFEKVESRERAISLFLSLLFLVWEGGIEVHQQSVGKSEIFVVRVEDNRDASRMLIGKPVAPAPPVPPVTPAVAS
jgi:segregation and condensation protein A